MKKEYSPSKIEDIKKSIRKIALELYEEDGYDEVTFGTIARLSELGRTAIYNYYSSKEDIFLDILLEKYEALAERIVNSLSPDKSLSDSLSESLLEDRTLLEMISKEQLEIESKASINKLAIYKEERSSRVYEPLCDAFRVRYPAKEDNDIDDFVMMLFSLIHGFYPLLDGTNDERFIKKTIDLLVNDFEGK